MGKLDIGDMIKPIVVLAILPSLLGALGMGSNIPGFSLITGLLPLFIIIPLFDQLDFGGGLGEAIKLLILFPMILNVMNGLGFSVLDSTTTNMIQTLVMFYVVMKVFENM